MCAEAVARKHYEPSNRVEYLPDGGRRAGSRGGQRAKRRSAYAIQVIKSIKGTQVLAKAVAKVLRSNYKSKTRSFISMRTLCMALFLAAATSTVLSAQGIKRGAVEVAGFGGGAWLDDGVGTNPAVGGSVGVALAPKAIVLGEFTYVPVGMEGNASGKMYDFSGVVHVPLTESKVAPYLAAGAGLGRMTAKGTVTTGWGGVPQVTTVSASESAFGINAGAGVRIYAGKNWGIRPEVKVHRYTGDVGATAIRFTLGFFFHSQKE